MTFARKDHSPIARFIASLAMEQVPASPVGVWSIIARGKRYRMDHSRIERIAVVGVGLMCHGIAQEFALAGYHVRLRDLSDDRLENALSSIRANLERLASLRRLEHARIEPAIAAITVSTDLGEIVSGAELIIG